ncbi:MAG: twin-arginine translocase subunit TatC [Chloroflexota bacterium]|nr:twin-arginine translocase subunit TatC [Chloroflexota bacterium]
MAQEENMTLFEHLEELRDRLIKTLGALGVATLLSIIVARRALQLLIAPMGESKPVALHPTASIISYFKISLILGTVLAMPVIIYQFIRFVVPGLTSQEKRYLYVIVPGATISFALGVTFAGLVILPFSIKYLQGFMSDIIRPTYSIDRYISFVTSVLFWVGLSFETPLVIFFLAKMEVVNVQFLTRSRKYALLIVAVLAAVITPTPDPFNMLIVMAPLVLLYELGVLLARLA